MKLFTIGHSIVSLEEFVDHLRDNGVELLVDVRSKPVSRLAHFDQVPLQSAIEAAGLRYRFMGDKLGGVPRDPEVQRRWRQGRLDPIIVAHLRSTEEWQEGIAELVQLVRRGGGTDVAIMCSERNVNECHRNAVALDAREAMGTIELQHLSVNKSAPSEVGVQEVML